mgnify:CR=1 FL=1|tara:strand:+ start:117 stop:302 length:186 start_codon:yes stop_codon:yes gene_type:complete
MIIYRADTKNNETLMKSLNGDKIITFYIKVEDTNKNTGSRTKFKSFFDKLELSFKKLPALT